ncbi:MAG: sulfatase-like hydrolase/transferase [Prolixibacteraceae bacterium]|nr:sulfatase-like hydrolase/transferase [Prolixibacteraceae bacterium]
MLKKITISCLAVSSLGIVTKNVEAKTKLQPNVIFIYADDLGRGMLSYEGQKIVKTPNIDQLAKTGMQFSNAYGCMLCAPARASLLTGYHDCHRDKWIITNAGIYKKISTGELTPTQVEAKLDSALSREPKLDTYLPQVFKRAGYYTAEIGKLEWGFAASHKQMKEHGWDYYFGYLDHVRCHGYYPPFLFENQNLVSIPGNTRVDCGKTFEPESEQSYKDRWDMTGKAVYSQDIFLEKILSVIRSHKNKPFFLFHPTQLPHGPVSIPQIAPEFAHNDSLTSIEKEYASMVKKLDDHVGVIVNELKKQGLYENTIIIFSADNGHEIYYPQKGRCEKPYRNMVTGELFNNITDKFYSELGGDVFNGNDGMAGLKRSNWDGAVKVPLIVSWPGKIQAKKSTSLVAMYDWVNTFADLLRVSVGTPNDGKSFLSNLIDKSRTDSTVNQYVVYSSYMGPALVTADGWKLRTFVNKNIFQLYYLPEDYREENELSQKYPEKVESLKKILMNECSGDFRNGVCTE